MDKSRTEILLGEEGLRRLSSKHITVVGIGGVGGNATVMLARAGIEKFTLIDFDVVSPSNLNRQIIAYNCTIGKNKVDVMKEMLREINDKIEVEVFNKRLTNENICSLIGQTDIVIDAIDSVKDKVDLIAYCKEHKLYIISAMGAGNRYDLPEFKLTDIYKTHDDGLAKAIRKQLRLRNVDSLDCVVSQSAGIKKVGRTVGSISYYPNICGSYLAAVVVNKILKGEI